MGVSRECITALSRDQLLVIKHTSSSLSLTLALLLVHVLCLRRIGSINLEIKLFLLHGMQRKVDFLNRAAWKSLNE